MRLRQQELREALPFLTPLAHKVARVHGDHEPRLREVRDGLDVLAERLTTHLAREERVLDALALGVAPDSTDAVAMRADHVAMLAVLARIRAAAADFVVPDWACGSYTRLMQGLERLEGHLSQQVDLEDAELSRPTHA
ncbi:MAG: hemerythrin domain-containing protein [Archangiaceae bacterium]|nr:hemerythrin domain-containing protein [Archangiaceae bacterium]